MQLTLVSFDLCPYVQRILITLLHKQADFAVEYIDLQNPPVWFTEISPLGKVPLLRVNGDTVLFESSVINEFVDEITPPLLQPEAPLDRAVNRSWVEFGSQCITDQYRLMTARDETSLETARHRVLANLGRVEQALGDGPWFNGERFSLVDTTFAPLLMRYDILNRQYRLFEDDELPRLRQWWRALRSLTAVRDSVPKDFESRFITYLAGQKGYGPALFTVPA